MHVPECFPLSSFGAMPARPNFSLTILASVGLLTTLTISLKTGILCSSVAIIVSERKQLREKHEIRVRTKCESKTKHKANTVGERVPPGVHAQ